MKPSTAHGGVAVNEATGNLIASAPAGSYPSASGSIGWSLSYNSQDARLGPAGFGVGWTLGYGTGGDDPMLTGGVTAPGGSQGQTLTMPDGSSSYYRATRGPTNQLGTVMISPPGSRSILSVATTGAKTNALVSPSGSVVNFKDASSAAADKGRPQSATYPAKNGVAQHLSFVHETSGLGRILSVTEQTQSGFPRTVTFSWGGIGAQTGICATAAPTNGVLLVCVKGPDASLAGGDGVVWQYFTGAGNNTGRLWRVVRVEKRGATTKARSLAQFDYDTTGHLLEVRGANEINSPADAAHPLTSTDTWNTSDRTLVEYDLLSTPRVKSITLAGVSGVSGASSTDLKTSFAYNGGPQGSGTYPLQPVRSAHVGIVLGAARPDGYGKTTITSPLQQGAGAKVSTVYYDNNLNTVEFHDLLETANNRFTSMQYNLDGQLVWGEDQYGQPTDTTYDAVLRVPLQTQTPDTGSGRPTTTYRYDETKPGLPSAPASSSQLNGLQAFYYTNPNLDGDPRVVTQDSGESGTSMIDRDYAAGTPAPLSAVGYTSGLYSARWVGYFDTTTLPGFSWYNFKVTSDDGSRLYIDDKLVIDNWGTGTTPGISGDVPVSPSALHKITLEYQNTGGSGYAHLYYCGNQNCRQFDANFSPMPKAVFRPGWNNQTSVIAPTATDTNLRMAFTHYAKPDLRQVDYSLVNAKLDSGAGSTTTHITTFGYDSKYGRLIWKAMPKANSGCTIAMNGDLTDPGGATNCVLSSVTTPNPTSSELAYITRYDYWDPTVTGGNIASNPLPAMPSGCAPWAASDQTGQLRQTTQNPTSIVNTNGVFSTSPAATNATLNAAKKTWYDIAGRPIASTDGKPSAGCLQYDDEGMLQKQYAPSEDATTARTFTHDPDGNLRSATGGTGATAGATVSTVNFDYDELGRVKRSVDAQNGEALFTYDADGRLTKKTADTDNNGFGFDWNYAYDDLGQLTQLTDPGGKVFKFGYDKRGSQVWRLSSDNTYEWNQLTNAGRLTSKTIRTCPTGANCGGLTTAPVDPGSAVFGSTADLAKWAETYDQDGRVTQDIRSGSSLSTQTFSHAYDEAGRLSTSSLTSSVTSENRNWSWSFDVDSNRATETLSGTGITTATTTYTYDPTANPIPDQLTKTATSGGATRCFTYDADGREITKAALVGSACTGADDRTNVWDTRDRHVDGRYAGQWNGGAQLDPLDRRYQWTSRAGGLTNRYYYYAGTSGAALFETDNNGFIRRIDNDNLADYTGTSIDPSNVASASLTIKYFNPHGDLGFTRTSGTGKAYTYEPYGKPVQNAPAADTNTETYVGSASKYLDSNSGLIEMGARPYDSSLGRFLAVDPVDGGSKTIYGYAGQDPIGKRDLTGMIEDIPDALLPQIRAWFISVIMAPLEVFEIYQRYDFEWKKYLNWNNDHCSNSPDAFGYIGASFRPACDKHDWGYRNRQRLNLPFNFRYVVDYRFRQDLQHICRRSYGFFDPRQQPCFGTADIYYGVVTANNISGAPFG